MRTTYSSPLASSTTAAANATTRALVLGVIIIINIQPTRFFFQALYDNNTGRRLTTAILIIKARLSA